jgi:hypothetical protein
MTISLSRGISTLIFFKLCWRAPLMLIFFIAVVLYQSMGDFIEIYFVAWMRTGCSQVQWVQVSRQRVSIPLPPISWCVPVEKIL